MKIPTCFFRIFTAKALLPPFTAEALPPPFPVRIRVLVRGHDNDDDLKEERKKKEQNQQHQTTATPPYGVSIIPLTLAVDAPLFQLRRMVVVSILE
jgi:hypothetical protein